MPNLIDYPTGAALLRQLGGLSILQMYINIHNILATERGTGSDIPGISRTANLPGVTFRFDGSSRANYCKILRPQSDFVHLEFRDIQLPLDLQVVQVEAFVEIDRLKQAFSKTTALYLPSCEER
jgi:hypothetical protein